MIMLRHLYKSQFILIPFFLLLIFFIIKMAFLLPDRAKKDDFAQYYIATRLFFSGNNPYGQNLIPIYKDYGFNSEGNEVQKTAYPPIFFYLLSPFAALSPTSGFILWTAVEMLCLFYILILTGWLLKNYFSARGWLLFSLLILVSNWTYYQFYYSQAGLLLIAMILSAFALNKAEKHNFACILVSLAGLIKFFPFVLLPWFLWRKKGMKKFPVSQILTVSAFITGMIFITGISDWINYYRFTSTYEIANTFGRYYNYSLPSFIVNLFYLNPNFKQAVGILPVLIPIAMFLGLFLILWGYAFCFTAPKDRELEFSFLTVLMLIGIPRTFGYYLIFLIFPMAVAFIISIKSKSNRSLIFMLFIFIVLNLHHLPFVLRYFHPSIGFALFLNYVPFYGLLGFLIFYYKTMKTDFDLMRPSVAEPSPFLT